MTPADRSRDRLRGVLGLATLLMLAVSRPLWAGDSILPRVPFIEGWPIAGGRADSPWFAAVVVSVAAFAATRSWRPGFAASVVGLVALIAADQHRFQPWIYQYLATGLALAALPWPAGRHYARLWFVSLYVHSGLSKLDVSFRDELGAIFLHGLLAPMGLDPSGWDPAVRGALVLAMPLGEIAAGLSLLSRRTRPIGRVAVVLMHLSLFLLLGPIGLDHSAMVQLWNLSMLAQSWILFAPDGVDGDGSTEDVTSPNLVRRAAGGLIRGVLVIGMVLPLGERWGVLDPWPAHALYASHVERLSVDLHASGLDGYPEAVRRRTRPLDGGPWHRLDLTGLSRGAREAPIYPGHRAGLGLAEGLIARYGGDAPARVILLGPAGPWAGRRTRTELVGLGAIRDWGDRFRWNAHPAPTKKASE